MSMYLTADTHFGHQAVINHCNRPFTSADLMDEALVENWNRVVHRRDVVWHLGDFALCHDDQRVARLFHSLNGDKRLVLGNHDLDRKRRVHRSVSRLPWTEVCEAAELNHDGARVYLCHYASFAWSAQHHGALHAFGHSHGKLTGLPGSVDVGVDAQPGYAPVPVEEFVRQARETFANAEERVGQVMDVLLGRLPRYAELAGVTGGPRP